MSAATLRCYVAPRPLGRRFVVILGLSIVLHGSLFAFTTWQRQRPPVELPPIIASIRMLAAPPSGSPAAVVPAPAAALPQKVRQPATRQENRSSPRVQEAAGPTIRSAPVQAGAAVADAALPAVASATSPAVASAPVAAAAHSAPAPDLLAAYRQRLTELLAGQREYPRIAALRGWEGEVRLRLRVARKGNLLGVVLDHSSGFDVLDQHALAMLASLGGLPPVPEALEGNEIQVVVPVSYKLNKTT